MASPGAGPSAPVEVPPVTDDELIEEIFFQCGARELALKLIGRYIHFPEDKFLVRILETEAYPEGDGVYSHRFPDDVTARFRALNGGTLLAWGSPATAHAFSYIYVTAGPVGTGDVVLLRSCEPVLGRDELLKRHRATKPAVPTLKNILINPLRLSASLGGDRWDFTAHPILYTHEGAQLLPGFVAEGETMSYGTRVSSEDAVEGTVSMLRFALRTAMNYNYEKKKYLVDYTAPA